MKIPDNIVTAVNALLAPYGERYETRREGPILSGYKSTSEACMYLGISKSSLYKLIANDRIHPIKLNKSARNGKVVFSVADLESYIASCQSPE